IHWQRIVPKRPGDVRLRVGQRTKHPCESKRQKRGGIRVLRTGCASTTPESQAGAGKDSAPLERHWHAGTSRCVAAFPPDEDRPTARSRADAGASKSFCISQANQNQRSQETPG